MVILHTGSIVSLMTCIFDLKKKCLCNWTLIKIVLCRWAIAWYKMEAFDDSHFMHKAVRGGHTEHTGSIVSLMTCIFDLKRNFYVTGNSSKSNSVCRLYIALVW